MFARCAGRALSLLFGSLLAVAVHAEGTTVSLPAPAGTAPASAPAAAPTPIAFETALLKAANDLFAKANLDNARQKVALIIDPLIDGITGAQSNATQLMEKRIVDLVKASYPRFEVGLFSWEAVSKSPVVLIGTFTAINNAGLADGPRDAYRICLALADLQTRKIISKGVARALPEGINVTPTAFFAESPVFVRDASTDAYVKSCQGTRPGDPIDQVYSDRILVGSLIIDGINAYNAKRYKDALELYESALRLPGGEQLRVLNGIYLSYNALHRRNDAIDAFVRVVDYGLKGEKLAVKFLFQPGSMQFVRDQRISAPYDTWLEKIAERTLANKACLEIVGHTSATGLPIINDRLSMLRAEYIKERLEAAAPDLRPRLIAAGKGSREMIVGTGKDDPSDAVDRRVEFKVVRCLPEKAPQVEAEPRPDLTPKQPQVAEQVTPVPQMSQEEICKRDAARLARLRISQGRDEVILFEHELSCEKLRPQVLRLRESVDPQ
jgi:outer membrane protein OmpA-like peptidoglycan-associated protein